MSTARRFAPILALILLSGACTSGDDDSSSTSAPDPATDETTGPTTIAGLAADEPVPFDPDVRTGSLANGMQFYVRENDRPGGHVELRLAVNAGSVLEEPDQAGVAHFLEHMLFNGTEQYEGNELVKVLQSFGSEFGADINAYTSFDETVYALSVPTQDPSMFDEALNILDQWLSHATIAEADVVAERGVVLDEWRQSEQDASGRAAAVIQQLFLTGSPYEGRDPIGSETAIQEMTAERLRRFYDDWYRPDNAAIVIVGDIDPDTVVEQLRDRFEPATARGDSPTRPTVELEPFSDTAAAVHLDPDESTTFLEVTLPVPGRVRSTPADFRDVTQLGLAFQMIANRLGDDVTRGAAPFTDASVSSNDFVRAIDAPSIFVESLPENTDASLDALLTEFTRVDQHGFTEAELARAVAQFRSGVDSAYEGRATVQDVAFAESYVMAFVTGSPAADATTEYELGIEVLESATVDEVEAAYAARRRDAPPQVLVIGPDDADVPTEADIVAMVGEIEDRVTEPRAAEAEIGTELMAAPEPVDEVAVEELDGEPGMYLTPTALTFANGVTVVLNPTPITEGTVVLGAASEGGTSLVPDELVPEANLAQYVVGSSGVGPFDQVQLEQVLADSSVSLAPYLDITSEGFTGSADTSDLETMFQLLHLYLTEPRVDESALGIALDQVRPFAEEPERDPDLAQQLALIEARYGDAAARFRPIPTVAELDSVDVEGIEQVWEDRFGDLRDWVFVFSGDLELDATTELARRYLGSLPAGERSEEWADVQPDAPPGTIVREVRAGTGERGTLTLLATTPVVETPETELLADLLTSIVSSRLTDHLREELGATYSPSADVTLDREPDVAVEVYVQVTGEPDAMTRLSTLVHEDLAELVAQGPTEAELDAALEELNNDLQLFSNQQLIAVIVREILTGDAVSEFVGQRSRPAGFDAAAVQAFAATVLPPDRYIEVVGLPS